MQNDGFFHAPFNAATLELMPENAKIFLRPGHFNYLKDNISAARSNWLVDKSVLVPRILRLPVPIADAWDALRIAWSHRHTNNKVVYLSSSSTTLAGLLLCRRFFGDIIVFAHSLDSILNKSARATLAVKLGAWLGSFLSRNKAQFVLAFQRSLAKSPYVIDVIQRAGLKVEAVHVPHPVVKLEGSERNFFGRRRFVFLGPPRIEKRPDEFLRIAGLVHNSYELAHISDQKHAWHTQPVKWIVPERALAHNLRHTDIVFCAYDDSHYDMTESGTFLDAISVGSWALLTKRRADQLEVEFPRNFHIRHIGTNYCLVKPRLNGREKIAEICAARLNSVLIA